MDVTLTREKFNPYGIFGTMTGVNWSVKLATLEHSFSNSPAVPCGVYTCQRRLSPKFNYDVFELLNVPGHNYIEIHRGNYNADSDGCILLGLAFGPQCILESRTAFDTFMAAQEGVNQFVLTIVDNPSTISTKENQS